MKRLDSKWWVVIARLRKMPPGKELRLSKAQFAHPRQVGMRPSIGLPKGQGADYRLRLNDGSGLHVHDFGTHYRAHLDQVDPETSLIDHLRLDAPALFVLGAGWLGNRVARAGRSKANPWGVAFVSGLIAISLLEPT